MLWGRFAPDDRVTFALKGPVSWIYALALVLLWALAVLA